MREKVLIQDFDIFGVEALRRSRYEKETRPMILQCHRDLLSPSFLPLYEDTLKRTLQWLKPQDIREVPGLGSREERVLQLMTAELLRSFPKMAARLEVAGVGLQDYLREFPWPGGLLTEHFRYFPWWLRKIKQPQALVDLAQREWIWTYLQFADFGGVPSEKSMVQGNPSLQILTLDTPLPEYQLSEGLYAYVYDSAKLQVTEAPLDVFEAALLDLLQEDRKFNRRQLLEQAALIPLGSRLEIAEWEKRLSNLMNLGMILSE